jgi:hypothetical protein
MDIPPLSQSSEFLPLASISDTDVCKAFRIKPSKYVGLDIHGCHKTLLFS